MSDAIDKLIKQWGEAKELNERLPAPIAIDALTDHGDRMARALNMLMRENDEFRSALKGIARNLNEMVKPAPGTNLHEDI